MKAPSILIFSIGLLLFNCRHQGNDSETRNVRLGDHKANSCYSNHMYHKRIREQLAYLGEEFLEHCFADPQPYTTGDLKFGVLENININQAKYNTWVESSAKTARRENFKSTSDSNYAYLPNIFRSEGKLASLYVLENLKTLDFNWRVDLKDFPLTCRQQLQTIHERALESVSITNAFKERKCCLPDQGGIQPEGELTCKEKSSTTATTSPDKDKNEIYFEWPICGPAAKLTCDKSNLYTDQDVLGSQCSRCEIRLPKNFSTFSNDLRWDISKDYNYDLARHTQAVCLNSSAARGAATTLLINRCYTNPTLPYCNSFTYNSNTKELFERLEPYIVCNKSSLKAKSDPNYVITRPSASVANYNFGSSSSIGGSISLSASANINILSGSSNISKQQSHKSISIFNITSNGNDHAFVVRDGVSQIGPSATASCLGNYSISSCASLNNSLSTGLNAYIAALTANLTAQISDCSNEGRSVTSSSASVGGLRLNQVKETCEQFHKAVEYLVPKKSPYKDIQKFKPTSLKDSKFFNLNIEPKNLYCMKGNDSTDEKTFRKKGIKIDRIYLEKNRNIIDAISNSIGTYYIGIKAEQPILSNPLKRLDEKSRISTYEHNQFKDLMATEVTNKTIQTYLDQYFLKNNKPMDDYKCRFINNKQSFKFNPPIACNTSVDGAPHTNLQINSMTVERVGQKVIISAVNNLESLKKLSSTENYAREMAYAMYEGGLMASAALEVFQSLALEKENIEISGCK